MNARLHGGLGVLSLACYAGGVEIRFDERDSRFGIDCIAVTAQSSHAGGSPMSQRECAGFNWPPLSIPAEEPISISPEAVSRAGPLIAAACAKSCGLPLRSISEIVPSNVRTFFSPSAWRGVGQPANPATSFSGLEFAPHRSWVFPFQSRVVHVGQPFSDPPEPLSDVGRADARSAEIDRPKGVVLSFQVSLYKVEPSKAVLARNLFASDDCRAALADKVVEVRP